MHRHPLLSAMLVASFAAVASSAAIAQDPASVGGGADPALVGNHGYYGGYRGAPGNGAATGSGGQSTAFDGSAAGPAQTREKSVREVETLLQMVRGQLEGTGDTSARGDARGNAMRYRSDAEVLIRRNWNQLGPLTRDLYTSNYDRTDPNDPNQRYRSPYGDGGQMEDQLLGGAQDAEAAMQNLEDLLLPMLRDLKQGFDAELRQRSR